MVDSKNTAREAVRRCLTHIELYEKEFEAWRDETKKILKRYRAEKSGSTNYAYDDSCQFNLFWSNLQLQAPILYAHTPVAQVERRNKDKELVPRVASELLERATRFQVQSYDFDDTPNRAVMDLLISGRGVGRVRYTPTMIGDGEQRRIVGQEVRCEYVNSLDFQHNSARTWDEVDEVRFKNYYSKKEIEALFPPEKTKDLKYTHLPSLVEENSKVVPEDEQFQFKKAVVWEIWDKKDRKVKWVSPDYTEDYLRVDDDPLGLDGFFPCPKPLFGTLTNDSLIPVPDARQAKKLYDHLDEVESKIAALTNDLKTAGVYPAHHPEIASLYRNNEKLIPIRDWAGLQKDGSLGEILQFLPLGHVVEALGILYQQKDQLKSDIYEITGMADIMRGVSDYRETASAQQRKAQFGSIRLSNRQKDVQRFARDLIALTGEIIAEHYTEETLLMMTGVEFITEPPAPSAGPNGEPGLPLMPEQIYQYKLGVYQQAVMLLRNDPMRRFRIDIETDSTIAIDEAQERQDKSDMLQSVTGFLQQMGQITQILPQALPLCGEMLQEVVRSYRCGRSLENAIEEFVETAREAAERARTQPAQPDPKMLEAQAKLQLEQLRAQHQMELEKIKMSHDIQLSTTKLDVERGKAELKSYTELEELRNSVILERAKLEAEIRLQNAQANADIKLKAVTAELDARLKAQKEDLRSRIIDPSTGELRAPRPRRKRVRIEGRDEMGNRMFAIEDIDEGVVN